MPLLLGCSGDVLSGAGLLKDPGTLGRAGVGVPGAKV